LVSTYLGYGFNGYLLIFKTYLIIALYLPVGYIAHHNTGLYIYPFLNPKLYHAAVAGYLIALVIGPGAAFTVSNFTRWLLETKLNIKPKRSSKADDSEFAMDEDVKV
jgi:hypothetical protein